MTNYEIITIVLSGIAIFASVGAIIQNYKLSNRQSKLEMQQSELIEKQLQKIHHDETEKKKTKIQLIVKSSNLFICNDGSSTAHNINIEVIPEEGKTSPLILSDVESKLPLKRLDPGDSIKLYWSIDGSTGTEFNTICNWENEDGSKGIKEKFIT
ncbi:MAG: hypothetical protein IIC75_02770 [Bacteroidetes bacterium]|nr:hypothetical protein [Bacteroidota bacterium]